MVVKQEHSVSIQISDEKEYYMFIAIIEKILAKNKEIGFSRNKLTAEESAFLEELYENIKK